MESTFRRQLNRGLGDGFSNAVEIALVPAIFGGLGWLLDSALGTDPFLFIGFLSFGFVGIIVKLWLRYDAAMAKEDEKRLAGRMPAVPPPAGGEVG